jgi:hypothetical protein
MTKRAKSDPLSAIPNRSIAKDFLTNNGSFGAGSIVAQHRTELTAALEAKAATPAVKQEAIGLLPDDIRSALGDSFDWSQKTIRTILILFQGNNAERTRAITPEVIAHISDEVLDYALGADAAQWNVIQAYLSDAWMTADMLQALLLYEPEDTALLLEMIDSHESVDPQGLKILYTSLQQSSDPIFMSLLPAGDMSRLKQALYFPAITENWIKTCHARSQSGKEDSPDDDDSAEDRSAQAMVKAFLTVADAWNVLQRPFLTESLSEDSVDISGFSDTPEDTLSQLLERATIGRLYLVNELQPEMQRQLTLSFLLDDTRMTDSRVAMLAGKNAGRAQRLQPRLTDDTLDDETLAVLLDCDEAVLPAVLDALPQLDQIFHDVKEVLREPTSLSHMLSFYELPLALTRLKASDIPLMMRLFGQANPALSLSTMDRLYYFLHDFAPVMPTLYDWYQKGLNGQETPASMPPDLRLRDLLAMNKNSYFRILGLTLAARVDSPSLTRVYFSLDFFAQQYQSLQTTAQSSEDAVDEITLMTTIMRGAKIPWSPFVPPQSPMPLKQIRNWILGILVLGAGLGVGKALQPTCNPTENTAEMSPALSAPTVVEPSVPPTSDSASETGEK